MNDSTQLCISKLDYIPPGGWACPVPGLETVTGRGNTFDDLVQACAEALTEAKIEIPPDLSRKVQDAICGRLPGYRYCRPCKKVKMEVGAAHVIRWVKAMFRWARKGLKLVSNEEAERRAEICARCPKQVETPSLCWGCHGVAGLIPLIKGTRKTAWDSQLKTCGICGCYNNVAVHLPLDTVDGSLEYPVHCWKAKQAGA
jgi:hypothetical protein